MDNLSTTQKKTLNGISRVRNPGVYLGNILYDVISRFAISGTPVNAVAASVKLQFGPPGTVSHGEKIIIGADVYEFLADVGQTKSNPNNIGVNILEETTVAVATLEIAEQPTSGDTMTIGDKEYIFVPVGTDTADGEISIGSDLAAARLNIVAAINGTDGVNTPHPKVTADPFISGSSLIENRINGSAGNIPLAETFTAATNKFFEDATNMSGGSDCSTADALSKFFNAFTSFGTALVGGENVGGEYADFFVLYGGAEGNEILVSDTLEYGAFTDGENPQTSFVGGSDGTVGFKERPMIDENYLYICIEDNDVSGSNWRRIALGSAF